MPNIKPVSDFCSNPEFLREVTEGHPLFLTEDGQGRYAILDIQDYDKMREDADRMTSRWPALYTDELFDPPDSSDWVFVDL